MRPPGIRKLTAGVVERSLEFGTLYATYLHDFGVPGECDAQFRGLLSRLLRRGWIGGFYMASRTEWLGFCIYSRTYSPVARSPAYSLDDMFVSPSHRRQGVPSRLVLGLVELARKQEAKRIYVNTDAGDGVLMRFYERNGFVDADANILMLEVT